MRNKIIRKAVAIVLLGMGFSAEALQWGPVFPTHKFPTERSFHTTLSSEYGSQSAYFDGTGQKTTLTSKLSRLRFSLTPEYQPSRQLSFGAMLNFDSLSTSGTSTTLAKSGLSDQFIFGEFRMIDERGKSLGIATVFKIPAYANPKSVDTNTPAFLMLGDAQVDGSFLVTGEYWATSHVKLFSDLGFTYRSDEHASEVPLNLGVEYVTKRYSVGASLAGNLSLGNDKTHDSPTTQAIQSKTGANNYVFATNPQGFKAQVQAEYAFNYQWAANAKIENSIWGKNSPYFFNVGAGVVFRFFEPAHGEGPTAREVNIRTDDTSDEFEGELQEGSGTPQSLSPSDDE